MDELKDLKRVAQASLYSILGITTLFITFAVIARSGTLVTYFVWSMAGIAVKVLALLTIGIMLRENQYLFPYGTGKLENSSAFVFGVSIAPVGLCFLVASLLALLEPRGQPSYGLCLVPVAASVTRSVVLNLWLKGILRRHPNPSPLLRSYQTEFRLALMSDSFLIGAFLVGEALHAWHHDFLAARVDPLLSVLLSLVMLQSGTRLIRDNLRALLDLPLPEPEMLKIVRVLTEFYSSYAGLGRLYTRRSGKRAVVEMELAFGPGTTLVQVRELERRMGDRLAGVLPDVTFRVLPTVAEPERPGR